MYKHPQARSCPCNSTKPYAQCCSPYIKNIKNPNMPEQLMRSRYTAYSLGEIKYIEKTQRGNAAKKFNFNSAKRWAAKSRFVNLKIVQTSMHDDDPDIGYVEFIASYIDEAGREQSLHEHSEFRQFKGKWFYVDS